MPLESFVERPLAVASALDSGACGGTYMEACLIISGVISAVSSFVWPGERIDRKRFVEAWACLSNGITGASNVSVPVLCRSLGGKGRVIEADRVRQWRANMFGAGYGARVLTGEEVDASEAELTALCPSLERSLLRRYAYPTVFYEHVRCKLVHEGELGDSAAPYPMTTRTVGVSYVNRMVGPPSTGIDEVHRDRLIHFHVAWLVDLARTIARNADAALTAGPIAQPAKWWLDD
jgi:hypothetical protein